MKKTVPFKHNIKAARAAATKPAAKISAATKATVPPNKKGPGPIIIKG